MLQNLNIINLAVVESLDLNLNKGLSVLTGETGAGKSILLNALGLALGERADVSFIRPDCQRAEVNLSFDLTHANAAKEWLINHELDDDEHCIIRRTITPEGRSKAYINGRPCTLQLLKQLSTKLVEIHGQHAYLTLLSPDAQRHFLDNYAQNKTLLNTLEKIYHQWQQDQQELEQLIQASTEQSHREELYRYQLDELEQLDLTQFDYEALSAEHLKLANLEHILHSTQTQLNVLDQHDPSLNQQLHQVLQQLAQLIPLAQDLTEAHALLSDAQINIQEATQQLEYFLSTQELDPQRLNELENEIAIIQALARKHQIEPEALPDIADNIRCQLSQFSDNASRIEALKAQVEQSQQQYQKVAEKLSLQRQKNALILAKKISTLIKELGMPQGEFSIRVTPTPHEIPKIHGYDKIEFLVSANKGLPLRPLAKVASGGELSRISLAIQVTVNDHNNAPTMIFDEVDSGIGGGIAEIIGQKLRELSQSSQVLCVTHLPQVASQAHQHLFVYKSSDNAMTSSSVKQLDKTQRIEETARMLGGLKITASTRAHAKEMLLGSQ